MPLQFKAVPNLFPEQRIWGCVTNKYTFVITEERGKFTASAKLKEQVELIDIGRFEAFDSFDEAKQACMRLQYD